MLNLLRHTALFPGRGFLYRVRRDVVDEVLSQIGGEVGKTLITQRLDRAHNRRCIDVVTFRQLAGREKERFFVLVENLPDQATSRTAQGRPGKANFKRRQ